MKLIFIIFIVVLIIYLIYNHSKQRRTIKYIQNIQFEQDNTDIYMFVSSTEFGEKVEKIKLNPGYSLKISVNVGYVNLELTESKEK